MYKRANETAPERLKISKTLKEMPVDNDRCIVFDLNNVKQSTLYNTISRLRKESNQTISYMTSYYAPENQLKVWRIK